MNLSGTQLKDTYGNLVTTGTSAGSPTTGGLQNGDGQLLTQIGIGTNSPSATLEILKNQSSATAINVLNNNSSGSARLRVGYDVSNCYDIFRAGSSADIIQNATQSSANIIWQVGGSEKVRIDSSGGVIFKGSLASHQTNAGAIEYFSNQMSLKSYGATSATGFFTVHTGGGGGVAGSEAMRIDSSGNVGIGTTSPTQALQVAGAVKVTSNFSGETSANSGYFDFFSGATRITSKGADGSTLGAFSILQQASDGSPSSTSFHIDSSGNVGIGTTSPVNNTPLTLQASSGYTDTLWLKSVGTNIASRINIGPTGTGNAQINNANGTNIEFQVSGSEKMRIDSSGTILVGKQTTSLTTVGVELKADGNLIATRAGVVASLNREDSDGTIVDLRKDGTTVGSIGVDGGRITLVSDGRTWFFSSSSYFVATDDAVDLGTSSYRFDDIYATNGSIITSDRNEKQDIEELNDAELRVAQKAKTLLRKYRWKSSVEEKGDDARIHFGIIAQDLEQAFTDEGLDAGRYGMFIKSTWTNEDGEEQTRLGVRYNQLLAFIISTI